MILGIVYVCTLGLNWNNFDVLSAEAALCVIGGAQLFFFVPSYIGQKRVSSSYSSTRVKTANTYRRR